MLLELSDQFPITLYLMRAYFPKEIRIYDEVEKGNSTLVVLPALTALAKSGSAMASCWRGSFFNKLIKRLPSLFQ